MIIRLTKANFSSNNIGQYTTEPGTLTFNVSPSNATATLTCAAMSPSTKTGTGAITWANIPAGSTVSYEVSLSGYNTQKGSISIYGNTSKTITLSEVGSVTPPVTPEQPGTETTELFTGLQTGYFVNYVKSNSTAKKGTVNQFGVKTGSNSAKCIAVDLEDGATYRYYINYKSVPASSRRLRLGLFNENVSSLNKVTVNDSTDLDTTECSKSIRIIQEDLALTDGTLVPDVVEGYFTNTQNAKSFVGIIGSTTSTFDVDVSIKKVNTDVYDINSNFVIKNTVIREGADGKVYTLTSPTGKVRTYFYEIEPGATYKIQYTNNASDTTRRQTIALFEPSYRDTSFARFASSNESCSDATVETAAVEVIKAFSSNYETTDKTFEYTFTNDKNARTLGLMLGFNSNIDDVVGTITKIR